MSRWAFLGFVVLLVLASGPVRAADGDGDTIDDAEEASLAQTYAPVLYFHPEEQYFPTSVQFAFDHSVLEKYNDNGPPTLMDANPTPAELATYAVPADPQVNPSDVYYLNNTLGSTRDDADLLAAYVAGTYAKTVYTHVATDGAQTIVQFWFYYAYNPGVWNDHEGDWETIAVVLAGGSPVGVGYSQHESGEGVAWADVDKAGTHPHVYVARGSHANYLRSYEGRVGIAGDFVSSAGPVWQPSAYTIVNVGERDAPTPGNEWIQFAGRWGEFFLAAEARAEAGPPGPAYRQGGSMFASPAGWAAGLAVPDSNVLLLNWFLANLLWIFLVLLLVSFAVKVLRLWRLQRRTRAGLKLWPFAHLLPFDRKSLAMVLAIVGLVVGLLGFLLPWYVVTVDVNAPGFLVTDGPATLIQVDGVDGVTVNPMKEGVASAHANILALPVGTILAVLTAYFLFRLAGTKTARRLGVRFIARGILALLPFVLVVLIASLVLPSLPADDPGQLGVGDFVRPIAEGPFGGSKSVAVEGNTGTLAWGLGIGSWLLIASAVIMFVAGAMAMSQSYAFLPQWYVDGYRSPEEAASAGGAPPPPVPTDSAPPPEPPEPPMPPG